MDLWSAVDAYYNERLIGDADPAFARPPGVPAHEVAPNQGKLLHLLARMAGARRILELGTLAGYSTIWLARAVGPGGSVVTLEADARFAALARAHVDRAGVGDRVEIRTGAALDLLPTCVGPFDLVFIDADKRSNAAYLDHALRLSRPGTVLVADNVVRAGAILDPATDDPSAQGIRAFAERLRDEPRVDATAIQTVGTKGHDGVIVALVVG